MVLLFRLQLSVRRVQGKGPWSHHHCSTGSDPPLLRGLTSCPHPQIHQAPPVKKESGACSYGRSESATPRGLDLGHFPSVWPHYPPRLRAGHLWLPAAAAPGNGVSSEPGPKEEIALPANVHTKDVTQNEINIYFPKKTP